MFTTTRYVKTIGRTPGEWTLRTTCEVVQVKEGVLFKALPYIVCMSYMHYFFFSVHIKIGY